MESNRQNQPARPAAKYLPAAVILLTLVILGGTIIFACQLIRSSIQGQIFGRDGRILSALWLSQYKAKAADETLGDIAENPADQLALILMTSQLSNLEGVLGIRLFDDQGKSIVSIPFHLPKGAVSNEDLERLRKLQTASHFHPQVQLEDLFLVPPNLAEGEPAVIPIQEVNIPLHLPNDTRLLGIAQFLLGGESIALELAALDRHLAKQAWVAFLGSGSFVALALGLAFYQLQKANRLLSIRTQSLLQANQELALAAKTSAIGAVTSHLIHGLRNPLSGLQNFMNNRTAQPGESDTEWQAAVHTTRRMQNLVSEVVRVLREENEASQYELSLEELLELIARKMAPHASQKGVRLQTEVSAEGSLSNREANLIMLVLENLLHNAIQATPSGKSVTLRLKPQPDGVLWEVRDEGSGLPAPYLKQLFKPCQSNKEGGSGIGLAISKQLASFLGADLQLKHSSAKGCSFTLSLPRRILSNHRQHLKAVS